MAMNTGTETASIIIMLKRLANSLPSTSSLLVMRVSNSSRRVRLSFSCPTAPAASVAAKKMESTSWTGARN